MSAEATEAVAERMAGYSQDYPDVAVERTSSSPTTRVSAIPDVAGDRGASLIVVGSRGRVGSRACCSAHEPEGAAARRGAGHDRAGLSGRLASAGTATTSWATRSPGASATW